MTKNAQLIFQSRFEGNTSLINDKFVGQDSGTEEKSNWQIDALVFAKSIAMNYGGGNLLQRSADIVNDPSGAKNRVLKFSVKDYWLQGTEEKSRVQLDVFNINPKKKALTQSVRVYFGSGFNTLRAYPKKIDWLTISEFWNNETWFANEKYGFRITVGVGKPTAATSDLNFFIVAEDGNRVEVWQVNNASAKVPVGKWCTLEYYFKEGDDGDGRFILAITPDGGSRKILYDVKNFTHHPGDPSPDGLSGYSPIKLYTSKEVVGFLRSKGESLDIYWDDWTVYDGYYFK